MEDARALLEAAWSADATLLEAAWSAEERCAALTRLVAIQETPDWVFLFLLLLLFLMSIFFSLFFDRPESELAFQEYQQKRQHKTSVARAELSVGLPRPIIR